MLFINGRNPIPSSKVDCLCSLPHLSFLSSSFSSSLLTILFFLDIYLLAVGSIQSSKGRKPNGYWNDIHNCRRFLEDIAKEKGFDPLNFHSWNSLGYTEVVKRVCLRFTLYFTFLKLTKYTGWRNGTHTRRIQGGHTESIS